MGGRIRRGLRQFILMILVLALSIPQLAPAASAAGENPTVRVGLFYGSSALASANLLNSTGSGYRLGYFDDSLNFVSLASTAQTALTMAPAADSYTELSGSYATFQAAADAAAGVSGAFPAWAGGSYRVRLPAGSGSGTAVSTGSRAVNVTNTDTGAVIFQLDSDTLCLAVRPGVDDSVQTTTWFKGYKYYGSFQYQRSGSSLTVCNVLPLEDYLKGVVSNEMSDSWPLEALKAQAVCARTYARIQMDGSKHTSQGFDLCNTNCCQVYGGLNTAGENTDQAVEETAGLCVWYDGALAETTYFSSDGGATESSENVWTSAVPYLRGVTDPYEASVADQISNYNWTVTFTADELTQRLRDSGYQCAQVVDFQVTQTTATGNALVVTVTDADGKSWLFSKEKARTFFGLRSQRFTITGGGGGSSGEGGYALAGGGTLDSVSGAYTIDGTGTVSTVTGTPYVITGDGIGALGPGTAGTGTAGTGSGTFTVSGSGWGHNVGMSQWGAYAMAKQGYTFQDILTFYYTGVEIA